MPYRIIILILLVFFSISKGQSSPLESSILQPEVINVEQAFIFDFSQQQNKLTLHWKVRLGSYLYRQKIEIRPENASLAPFKLPEGKSHEDEFYGKTEIYPDDLTLPLTLTQASQNSSLLVVYQGCAATGFCFPPEKRLVPLMAVAALKTPAQSSANEAPAAATKITYEYSKTPPFSPFWALLIGIGMAFTPCVLPMYPLISSIILGGGRQFSSGRLFSLSFAYVQGMALTYTLLGVIVAAAGLRFQATLQQPWVLIMLSVLFIILALSMFGLFTLQLPSSIQTQISKWSNRQKSGSLIGVLIMGALAGLICSPCTTAPLSAILLYIAQSGNIFAGAGTLYLYAIGMGLPLILVTLCGKQLLPANGPWMQTVKEGFGFIILALPVFLLERVIGENWGIRLWSLLAVAFSTWAFVITLKSPRGWARILQVLLFGTALVAVRPLQDWAFGPMDSAASKTPPLSFTRINNIDELNHALQQHQDSITMLDLFANWCVACKEFEKYTFRDKLVQNSLRHLRLLQIDVTSNSPENIALLKHLQVLGLPTVLFFDQQSQEIPGSRINGFMKAATFRDHLQKLNALSAGSSNKG